jgi:hypothetical protein
MRYDAVYSGRSQKTVVLMLNRVENLKSDTFRFSLYSFHVAGIILYRASAFSILVYTRTQFITFYMVL